MFAKFPRGGGGGGAGPFLARSLLVLVLIALPNIRRLRWACANADPQEHSLLANTQYTVVDENSDQAPRL